MKRQVILWVIRGIFLFFCCALMIINGGDSHPSHGKTVFEGWERPILPSVTENETTVENQTEVITERLETFEESIPATEPETDASKKPESGPIIVIGHAEYRPETHTGCLNVTLSAYPENQLFACLFVLRIKGDGAFYEVTNQKIPDGLTFTYIIYNGDLSILIDGNAEDSTANKNLSFDVILNPCSEEVPEVVVEYREYADQKKGHL